MHTNRLLTLVGPITVVLFTIKIDSSDITLPRFFKPCGTIAVSSSAGIETVTNFKATLGAPMPKEVDAPNSRMRMSRNVMDSVFVRPLLDNSMWSLHVTELLANIEPCTQVRDPCALWDLLSR